VSVPFCAAWVAAPQLAALLDGTLSLPHAPAALVADSAPESSAAAAAPAAAAAAAAVAALCGVPIAAAQLLGVYPNGRDPPEGLGLAHHYVLGRWIDAGCPAAPPV
jgi:hypothetical protein